VKNGCTLSVGCSPALDTLDRNCPRKISDNGVLPNSVHRVTAPLFFGPIIYIKIETNNVMNEYNSNLKIQWSADNVLGKLIYCDKYI